MKDDIELIHTPAEEDKAGSKRTTSRKAPNLERSEAQDTSTRLWWWVLYLGVIAIFAVFGAFVGQFVAGIKILDVEEAVTNYQQNVSTRIIDGSGEKTVSELAEERRVLISYDQIPEDFVNALISIEDKGFLNHHGVDLVGIARALWKNVTSGEIVQGGSTISQQLIKNLFLTPEQTYTRKVKEAILALQLEGKYTKEEILGFYCNTIYFGHQRYGLEAAARFYFDKNALELEPHQAALLAGVIRAPARYTPLNHPERALQRRNLVLSKMVEIGKLSEEEATQYKARPLDIADGRKTRQVGDYYIEEVRRFLVNNYGRDQTLGGGLKVHTSMDPRMQAAAEHALRMGLLELSMRQPIRPIEDNVIDQGLDPDEFYHSDWNRPFEIGEFTYALITDVQPKSATIRIAEQELTIKPKDVGNQNGMLNSRQRTDLTTVLKAGDVLPARIDKLELEEVPRDVEDEEVSSTALLPIVKAVKLSQEPMTEAALVAIEAQTGRVLAMVGGYDFSRNQFNNAIQAKRQTGSSFKPIVLAAAIEHNKATLGDTIFDEPTVFDDPQAPELYEPENYKKAYHGISTTREIIEKSYNISAIKLMLHAGIPETIETAQKMGAKEPLPPIFSLALGSIEMRLIDVVGMYSVFPNQGVFVEPYLISSVEDNDGNILFEHSVRARTAVKQSTAFLTTQALIGVFERGTAGEAKGLMTKYAVPLGGKTGTTDEYTDALFVGFSPQIVCGVWVGNKEKVSIGDDESGARAALPIWKRFMDVALEPEEWRRIRQYEIPRDVAAARIDRRNGMLAGEYTPFDEVMIEFFLRGTEPTRATNYDDDYNLRIEQINLQEKRVTIIFDDDPRVLKRDFVQFNY